MHYGLSNSTPEEVGLAVPSVSPDHFIIFPEEVQLAITTFARSQFLTSVIIIIIIIIIIIVIP